MAEIRNRVWNVTIGMGIALTMGYIGVTAYLAFTGKMPAGQFVSETKPLVMLWIGAAVAMLKPNG